MAIPLIADSEIMNVQKKLNAIELRINVLRLEIISLKDDLQRQVEAGVDQLQESFLNKKLKMLAKKFELAQMKSEKKLMEMHHHDTGPQAA